MSGLRGGNGTHEIHYYITRGRVGARREKDAEERITNSVELQLKKTTGRKRQEDDIGKQEKNEM